MKPISDIFNAFRHVNVLVVGDSMVDRYLCGEASRISPEAPVPIVDIEKTDDRLGGAANVALNLKSMGATPYLCSIIGNDEAGDVLNKMLQEHKLSKIGVLRSKDRITTIKSRVMVRGNQLIRLDREQQDNINEKEEKDFLSKVKDILETNNIDVILFQDYNKGVLTQHVIRSILTDAIRRDIAVVVDPKEKNFFEYRRATLFKPNLREIKSMVSFPVEAENLDSLRQAAQYIRTELGVNYVLITLSDKGMYFDDYNGGFIIPAHIRNIADVCGAGDTVVSLAALGLATKMDKQSLVMLANLGGGIVCEKVGVVPIDKAELKAEFEAIKKGN